MMRKSILSVMCICVLLSLGAAQEAYKTPPPDVVKMVTASPPPQPFVSPMRDKMILAESEAMPSIDFLSQPMLRLAGMRFLPRYNSSQPYSFYVGMTLLDIRSGQKTAVDLPEGSLLGRPSWSSGGKWAAFIRYTKTGCELWILNAATGKAEMIPDIRVNATLTSGFSWLKPGKLVVFAVDKSRGAPPKASEVPDGPNAQETSGKKSKVWTYQDLLQTPHDEALFTYYATSRLLEIDAAARAIRPIGDPDIYVSAGSSPDGKYLLVERVKKPYSYWVPWSNFAHSYELWNSDGKLVKILADLPVADQVPMRGVAIGMRAVSWKSRVPATLIWAEALDGGDPKKEVEYRDRIMMLPAPFDGEPKEILKTKHRYAGISWLEPEGRIMVREFDMLRRWKRIYFMDLKNPSAPPAVLCDISHYDGYNDPGRPLYTITEQGKSVILQEKDSIYLSGRGASPEGDRPFLDRLNLKTMKKERLFHSARDAYESFICFTGKSRKEVVIQYESKTEPPNLYVLNLKKKKMRPLTEFQDPAPQMTWMIKKRIDYKREDGVDLYGTLYLPPDYKEGERLPLVLWAYPIEYDNPSLAGQRRGSPHRFTFFRGTSQLFFITQGYAVLDGAQMPVVGDVKTKNDTFIQQIVGSAKAAIDKLDEMGIIDPKRVGVGGHSYGAFMTANLLAHCDLFAAGVARSGAYNRSLTPFGFQNEQRTFWEAPEIYFKVSPFMHANKINEPILLIHGEIDNNSGTYPIQSKRMYHALKGHGATARLVMLPMESHGYRAKESVLHVLWEMFEWFDKYVRNKK